MSVGSVCPWICSCWRRKAEAAVVGVASPACSGPWFRPGQEHCSGAPSPLLLPLSDAPAHVAPLASAERSAHGQHDEALPTRDPPGYVPIARGCPPARSAHLSSGPCPPLPFSSRPGRLSPAFAPADLPATRSFIRTRTPGPPVARCVSAQRFFKRRLRRANAFPVGPGQSWAPLPGLPPGL